jgi:putative RecB family exonuclease
MTRPHWSYSQLAQYMRCPLQYYFERVAQLPRVFIPSNLLFGSAIHAGLAVYHRQLQQGEILAVAHVHEAFQQTWLKTEQFQPISYSRGKTRTDYWAQAEALLATYLQEPPPTNIVAIEAKYTVPLKNSAGDYLPKPLQAVLDLVCQTDQGIEVTEFKTSQRRYGEHELDNALQATCYAHVVQQRCDEIPALKYVVLVKTQKPAIQQIKVQRSEHDFQRLGDLVEVINHAVKQQVFYPNESPLNCSGCSYRLECLEWQGKANLTTHIMATT